MADKELRRYGPGKFDTMLDAAVYELSLDGCDEEVGSVHEVGYWCCVMYDGVDMARAMAHDFDVTEDELTFVETEGKAGVILCENDQGFVVVRYYDDRKQLDDDWAQAEHELQYNPEETKKLKAKLLR